MRDVQMPDAALKSWAALNEALKKADEGRCLRLLKLERGGKRRQQFMLRIQSRLNRVRAYHERLRIFEEADPT